MQIAYQCCFAPVSGYLCICRSSTSWQCPACSHTLSTRASNSIIPSAEDPSKSISKKTYYQACNFCRWTTRGIGMPDKDVVSAAWSEKNNPEQLRIRQLMDYYRYLAQKETAEQAQRKSSKKRGYFSTAMQLQQRYGGPRTPQSSKKHPAVSTPLSSSLAALRLKGSFKEVTLEPAQTCGIDEVEKLPDEIYTKKVDFTQIASIQQRLYQPSRQIEQVEDFWPRKSTMFVKRSLRCKKCDHNIIKPEYNSSSIKFKIQLVAVHHIPEVRIHKEGPIIAGSKNKISLSLINPTEHDIHISFLPNTEENNTKKSNATTELPSSEIVVLKYDEAAEYISTPTSGKPEMFDDPSLIIYRRANKIGFYLQCVPNADLAPGDDVWITFRFRHEHYGNASVVKLLKGDDAASEPAPTWLTQTVFVNIGKVADK
ncbi:unnamed protein product [Clavelina lepadiformis]|uniref:Dynactin subunit 4 n=1 Tax=Clavelina lepadiformis TaxID=159417 RepID=A0ABP0H1A1_CLALP